MSKYQPLWDWIKKHKKNADFNLSFAHIETILGFPIDHSFLVYKSEAEDYGFVVGKISMNENQVKFIHKEK